MRSASATGLHRLARTSIRYNKYNNASTGSRIPLAQGKREATFRPEGATLDARAAQRFDTSFEAHRTRS
jgi:hypothetical protein